MMIPQLNKVIAEKPEPAQVVIPVQPAPAQVVIPVQPAPARKRSAAIPIQATATPRAAPTATPTLPPAVVVQPTPAPTPSPAQPAGLYLQGQYIPVKPASTSPEILAGIPYERWQVPPDAAGHHTDTPAFGEQGNVILVGHSIWYGELKVFAPVLALDSGDMVTGVNADGARYTYRVIARWDVDYDDGSWLTRPAAGRRLLTLYTCNLRLTGLVVVQAELVP